VHLEPHCRRRPTPTAELAKAAARGRDHPRIQSAWTFFFWGTPAIRGGACALSLAAAAASLPIFWIGLLVVSAAGI